MDPRERNQRLSAVNEAYAKYSKRVERGNLVVMGAAFTVMYLLLSWSFLFSLGLAAVLATITYFTSGRVVDVWRDRAKRAIETEFTQAQNPGI